MNLAPIALPITNGTTFYNKYRLMRPIGSGSFGEVWLAQDQAVNHEYAVKILNPGIGVDQRLREAQVGHAFTHNNLVPGKFHVLHTQAHRLHQTHPPAV